jgi:hypothetical protein
MHHHPTQSLPQAERRTLSTFFDSDALGPKPASVRKDGGAIFDNVFVKQDASLSIAQQPRQRSLSVQERAIAHVLAVSRETLGFGPLGAVRNRAESRGPIICITAIECR